MLHNICLDFKDILEPDPPVRRRDVQFFDDDDFIAPITAEWNTVRDDIAEYLETIWDLDGIELVRR